MTRILFQGDSITDAGRARDNNDNLGAGYPAFVQARLGADEPGKYEFINRGISGNRVVDLYARIKADMINLAPDVMSILIGVNDVWHEVDFKNGVDTPKFERIYGMLLDEFFEACPNTKVMIMEPFVLPGSGSHRPDENGVSRYPYFRREVEARAAASRRIAEKYHLAFLPLQATLDEVAKNTPEGYWLVDGVHPGPYGRQLIADLWIKKYKEM